jgi:hypothetical protein
LTLCQKCINIDLPLSYKVTSWSIVRDPSTGRMVYDITFQRLSSESNMEAVLQRPWTEEVEDYGKYKRFKRDARDRRFEAAMKTTETRPGVLVSGSDGTSDAQLWPPDRMDSIWNVYDDQTAVSPKGSVVVLRTDRELRGR